VAVGKTTLLPPATERMFRKKRLEGDFFPMKKGAGGSQLPASHGVLRPRFFHSP
jgi:hypothetical protein